MFLLILFMLPLGVVPRTVPDQSKNSRVVRQNNNDAEQEYYVNYWPLSPYNSPDNPDMLRDDGGLDAETEYDPNVGSPKVTIIKQKVIELGGHGRHRPLLHHGGIFPSHSSVSINSHQGVGGFVQPHHGFAHSGGIHGGVVHGGGGFSHQQGFASSHTQATTSSSSSFQGGLISNNGFIGARNRPTNGFDLTHQTGFSSQSVHSNQAGVLTPQSGAFSDSFSSNQFQSNAGNMRGGGSSTNSFIDIRGNNLNNANVNIVKEPQAPGLESDDERQNENVLGQQPPFEVTAESELSQKQESAKDIPKEIPEEIPEEISTVTTEPVRLDAEPNNPEIEGINEEKPLNNQVDATSVESTESEEREASPEPTHHLYKHKLKGKKQPMQYYQYAPSYYHPGYVGSEHDFDEILEMPYPDDYVEEASPEPTLHKLKKKKLSYYHAAPSYHHYPGYVGAEFGSDESTDIQNSGEFDRDASADPTLHLHKYKKQQSPHYYPPQSHHYYPNGYVGEENFLDDFSNFEDFTREASPDPTLHKLKAKKRPSAIYYYPINQQYHYNPGYGYGYVGSEFFREGQENDQESILQEPLEPEVGSPNLFNIRGREEGWRRKRDINDEKIDDSGKIENFLYNKTAEQMIDILNQIGKKLLTELLNDNSTSVEELQNLGLLQDNIRKRRSTEQDEVKSKISKKKNQFKHLEQRNHKKQAKKDRSNVKKEKRQSTPLANIITDPNTKVDIPRTFNRLGVVTRKVSEDQNAPIYHMKNLLGSSRDAVLSSMRIPPQHILPSGYKIVRIDDDEDIDDNFDDIGDFSGQMVQRAFKSGTDTFSHINDIAHNAKKVLHTSPNTIPRVVNPYARATTLLKPTFNSRLGDKSHKVSMKNRNSLDNTIDTLEDAKLSVNARNLKDFLTKMKRGFVRSILMEPPRKSKCNNDQVVEQFLEDLFDKKEERTKDSGIVGAGLPLSNELYHPFMGRASNKQLRQYLRESNSDENVGMSNRNSMPSNADATTITVNNDVLGDFLEYLRTKKQTPPSRQHEDLGYVLGSINPLMFERNFNETLIVKNSTDPQTFFANHKHKGEDGERVGTFMSLTEPMLKPFMNQAPPEEVEELMESYNDDNDYYSK